MRIHIPAVRSLFEPGTYLSLLFFLSFLFSLFAAKDIADPHLYTSPCAATYSLNPTDFCHPNLNQNPLLPLPRPAILLQLHSTVPDLYLRPAKLLLEHPRIPDLYLKPTSAPLEARSAVYTPFFPIPTLPPAVATSIRPSQSLQIYSHPYVLQLQPVLIPNTPHLIHYSR